MKKTVLLLGLFLFLTQCKVNQFTGKKTLQIYGNKTVLPQAFKAYDEFISTNKVIRNTPASNQIQDVGKRITQAAEAYFKYKQNPNYLDDYAWEYNLVEDKAINAWCMPGGKIVFYTGIMDIAKTEAGIAAIMGHEVAHALANHGAQRMSALPRGVCRWWRSVHKRTNPMSRSRSSQLPCEWALTPISLQSGRCFSDSSCRRSGRPPCRPLC